MGIYSYAVIFLLLAFNILIITSTPAITFLRAKMKNRMLLFVLARDKQFEIKDIKTQSETCDVENYGTFAINPESIYRLRRIGIPMAIAYGDYGSILNPKIIKAIEELKKAGMESLDDAEKVEDRLYSCNGMVEKEVEEEDGTMTKKEVPCGFSGLVDFIPVPDPKDETKTIGWKYKCPECESKDMTKQPLMINTPAMDTINFHDIIGFFKYNINPNFIKVRIERRVAEALAEQRDTFKNLLKWISIMSVLVVCGAVAYVIVVQNAPAAGGVGSSVTGALGSIIG